MLESTELVAAVVAESPDVGVDVISSVLTVDVDVDLLLKPLVSGAR